jgi:hypothetical protein
VKTCGEQQVRAFMMRSYKLLVSDISRGMGKLQQEQEIHIAKHSNLLDFVDDLGGSGSCDQPIGDRCY